MFRFRARWSMLHAFRNSSIHSMETLRQELFILLVFFLFLISENSFLSNYHTFISFISFFNKKSEVKREIQRLINSSDHDYFVYQVLHSHEYHSLLSLCFLIVQICHVLSIFSLYLLNLAREVFTSKSRCTHMIPY